jgi:hypothetical protein
MTPTVYQGTRLVLMVGQVSAGGALALADQAALSSLASFTGVAVAAVMTGTQIGIQVRRRHEGEPGRLVELVALLVVLVTMVWLFHSAVGEVLARLEAIAFLAMLAASVLGYVWHDRIDDQIDEVLSQHQALLRRARAELEHRSVRRFEAAAAGLRSAASDSLEVAYERLQAPRLAAGHDESSSRGPVPPPDWRTVDQLLAAIVGPQILNLTPREEVAHLIKLATPSPTRQPRRGLG